MPTQPPRNADGEVIPYDDPAILGEHWLIRRISPEHVVPDPKIVSGRRISSLAFNKSSGPNGGMSVDLQNEIEQAGKDPRTYVRTPPWVGAVRFRVSPVRQEGFIVGADPIDAGDSVDANPYHGEVWGRFSKAQKNALRRISEWFIPIEGVSI